MKFITFSQELGSNGTEIARQVAHRLGYSFHNTESIDHAARQMGLLESVTQVDEKAPSFFSRFFSHKPSVNLDRLNSVIYHLANQGDAVFLGRGGQILLKSFDCALHVRIIASRPKRIQNLVMRGYVEEAAAKAIEQNDREKSNFIKFAFGVDWDDAGLYDLVLNMDKLSIGLAVETVANMARSEEVRVCSLDSMAKLGKLALASRAEAAIIESGLSYGLETAVSVTVDKPGEVRLTGLVEDENSKIRAEEVLKAVPGVESVDNQIRVRPADRHA